MSNNYRDFFKSKKVINKNTKGFLPEGVTQMEYAKGIKFEMAQVNDAYTARHLALRNLREDAQYYSKITETFGMEEPEVDDIEIDAEEPTTGQATELDADNDSSFPKVGGALAVPHVGQPISLGKIIQVGNEFGKSASGELSGFTSCDNNGGEEGNATTTKEVPASQPGDKEPMLAGGKGVDSSFVAKTVGGNITPNAGQKQGGLNSKGKIAGTPSLNEQKNKIRKIVKEVLKEIKFNKKTGKWVKINENAVTTMKMGASYKVVQPRQYKVMDDTAARANQFEPEISEMYDDEEECMMNERYTELANAKRNLSEAELQEFKNLREKIERLSEENWIKNAVNPDHKGYCTPMSKSTCTPHRKAFAKRAKAHQLQEEDNIKCNKCGNDFSTNGGSEPNCPSCKGREMAESEVNMKMGNSYKKVQPTQAKTSELDQFARTNQYDPEVTEADEQQKSRCPECGSSHVDIASKEQLSGGGHGEAAGGAGECKDCGNTWNMTDEDSLEKMKEAGGGATQHSSYRTVPHGNLPQNGKQRWENDID